MDEIDNNSNPLIECPLCKKKMKGKNLAGHAKWVHAKIDNSIFQGHRGKANRISVEPKEIAGSRDFIIDESGFLIDPTLDNNLPKNREIIPAGKEVTNNPIRKTKSPKQSRPLVQTNIFNEIKQHKSKIPGAFRKRLHPHPDQIVTCPICKIQSRYIVLFDHVKRFHKDHNAKMVLAQFNRDYENS